MAGEVTNHTLVKAYEAAAAITDGAVVDMSSDTTIAIATATTDLVIGVAIEAAAAAGDRLDICMQGIATCVAGGNIARGALVMPTTSGNVITATGVNTVVGRALKTAVSGDRFPVLLGGTNTGGGT